MNDCIKSFKYTLIDAYKYADRDTLQFKEGIDISMNKFRSTKEWSFPHESSRRLIELLPHAATNVLQYCLRKVKKHILQNEGGVGQVEFEF